MGSHPHIGLITKVIRRPTRHHLKYVPGRTQGIPRAAALSSITKITPSSYEILDEGLGIIGMRAVKLDIKNALNFKQANFASGERNSKKIFNKVALKKGPIDPVELVDAYIASNKALWKVQKTMSDDIKGAQELGMSTSDVFLATKTF